MTREIVLDTETTGMDPEEGHRIIEIGCVELLNHVPTGKHLQLYINPEREVPPEAVAVHGITDDFLADKPVFAQVYSKFIDFVGDRRLVIHNAEFDMKFINWELRQVGHAALPRSRVTDTLEIARRKFPGSPANLDALCRRFGIDNTERDFHGALLDSELLAEVYLELLGGRQHGLELAAETGDAQEALRQNSGALKTNKKPPRKARVYKLSAAERAAHQAMVEKLTDPLWLRQKKHKEA